MHVFLLTLHCFPNSYSLSVTVLTLWVAPPKLFNNKKIGTGFNGAKTNKVELHTC